MARPPRWLAVTSVLGALALGAAGAWFYLAQRQYLHQVASANILAVAQAKLDEIAAWRTERLGDAAVLQDNPLFVRAVARWLAGRRPDIAAEILTLLQSSKNHRGYHDVRLVDRAGRVVLAASGRLGAHNAEEAAALRVAFRERRPTMGDWHHSSDDSFPPLAVVAPLFTSSGRSAEPIGAVCSAPACSRRGSPARCPPPNCDRRGRISASWMTNTPRWPTSAPRWPVPTVAARPRGSRSSGSRSRAASG